MINEPTGASPLALTFPATSNMAASVPPGPRASSASESVVVPSPAMPTCPATAISRPQGLVVDSLTPSQQMALQLLRSGLLEEPCHSRALAAVLTLPDARHLEFRALDSSGPPNLVRMQNLEAAIGFTVGELVQPPCTDYVAGYGQFAGCVRVEGLLHESCTNCHFGGEGARCSLDASAVPSAPGTGSPSGRFKGLRAQHPAASAASCTTEALTGGVGRGLKRPPQLKDTRPSRHARTSSPARAAASRAPPTHRPDDPCYVGNEEHPTHTCYDGHGGQKPVRKIIS
ncbi:hypothetical protein GMDG_01758 [Pseudogymnoascus destructans 20631-21]|uniref:Uncharacterized protein n=1 Tax=Pseudogymnoascus destructans (strain ATCC MYA-4855 / 20631-21) TaxID=658429 RepID=L8FYA1_PSED2|nr:hypothetical protein GMDG_01758 [Pseudogymnoascus destructans 20631-21]